VSAGKPPSFGWREAGGPDRMGAPALTAEIVFPVPGQDLSRVMFSLLVFHAPMYFHYLLL